jgi:hypothetical protein
VQEYRRPEYPADKRGIEFGPLANPIVRKAGGDILYIDWMWHAGTPFNAGCRPAVDCGSGSPSG